jgi:hypothetical protein
MGLIPYDYRADVTAMWESNSRIRCTLQRSVCDLLGSPINVEVGLNGQDFTSSGQTFTFPMRMLIDTDVKVLPIGTIIGFTVRGLGLATGPAALCRLRVGSVSAIGTLTVLAATNKDPTNATCVINTQLPAASAAILDLLLADGQTLWSTDQATIALQPPVLLFSTAPLFLFANTDVTWVNVSGTGFRADQTINCVVNGVLTSARVINSTLMQCPVKASEYAAPSSVSIEVTNVLPYAFTNSGVRVMIRQPAVLNACTPTLFSRVGDMQVTIIGSGFQQANDAGAQPMCVFTSVDGDRVGSSLAPLNMISVSSTVLSDSIAICQLGSQPALPVMTPIAVSFTTNGIHFAISNASTVLNHMGAPTLQLFTEPTLLEIVNIRTLPSSGQLNLTILGTNFLSNDQIGSLSNVSSPRCFWEPHARWSSATIYNSTYVVCDVPSLISHPSVNVSVSLDGIAKGRSTIQLLIYDPPRLFRLWPNTGSMQGGSVVDLYGADFPVGQSLCVFGSVFVKPAAMNSTWIQCISPAVSTVGNVSVWLSFYNNQTRTHDARDFKYYQSSLFSLSPSFGNTSGGSEIHINGTGFFDTPHMKCRFRSGNHSLIADVISSNSSYAASSEYFEGRSIITTPGLLVAYSSAWIVSSTEVACITPAFPPSVNVLVDVTLNGHDFIGSALKFNSVPSTSIQVFSYFPTIGRSSGDVPLNITGYGFGFGQIGCTFDDELVHATVLSPNWIQCTVPRRADKFTSTVRVISILDGMVWQRSAPFLFYSVAEPAGSTVVPLLGSFEGGYPVVLIGVNFFNLSSVRCKITSMNISAAQPVITAFSYINSSAGICMTPPANQVLGYTPRSSTQITISLIYNGQDTAPSIVLFTYVVGNPHVFGCTPALGGGSGDFDVIINGTDFVRTLTLMCRFRSPLMAEKLVLARYVSSTSIVCNAPATPFGTILVDVTNDGINYSNDFASYISVDMALTNVLNIVPTHGPLTGGTLITATLLIHSNVTQLFRLANSLVVTKSFLATPVPGVKRKMIAVVPPTTSTPNMPMIIEVSLDDGLTWSPTPVKFTYDPQIAVYNSFPVKVFSNWTRPITIMGANFLADSAQKGEILCRFNHTEVLRAAFINSSAVVCQQPYYGTFVGTIPIDVTQNNYQYVSGITLTLVPRPTITDVTPKRFQSDGSNADMWLVGTNFEATVRMVCRFMSANVDKTTQQAIVYNSTRARCAIPPMWNTIDNLTVVVSIDDGAFFSEPFVITAEPSVSVISLYPSSGLATQPMLIWLTGRFFMADQPLLCSVGVQGLKSNPIFVLGNTVACLVPPAINLFFTNKELIDTKIDNSVLDVDVPVSIVSLNGKEVSSPAAFRYLGQCPIGSYCPDNVQVLPCPTGAFCPITGLNKFLLCPPGTFQPRAASMACLICVQGAFCPDFGMPMPAMCPPGWVCDTTSLSSPNDVCGAGFFCASGSVNSSTSVLDVLVFNSFIARHQSMDVTLPGGGNIVVKSGVLEKATGLGLPLIPAGPLACPLNTYCYYGVGTNATNLALASDGMTHPRYCMTGVICSPGSSQPEGSLTESTVPPGFWAP